MLIKMPRKKCIVCGRKRNYKKLNVSDRKAIIVRLFECADKQECLYYKLKKDKK